MEEYKNRIEIAELISNRIYPLAHDDIKLFTSIITQEEFSKGEMILKEGEIANDIFWVGKGMIREFYYKNGKDITEHFACEGQGALSITSIFKNEPTHLMIEAYENSIVFRIPYKKFITLAQKNNSISTLLRKLLEGSLIMSQEKADSWRYETVQERYERFLREYPEAAKRASVNHIASYLLMTPETLSRVRAKLS